MSCTIRGLVVAILAPLVMLGCVADPSAPLIRTPQRAATVLPSEAPERTEDGFANILADPVTVAGLPRNPREIEAEERSLEAEARQAEYATSNISTSSSAAALAARGRDHVAEARAAIEASGRANPAAGSPGAVPLRQAPGASATPPPPQDPGQPLDPDAPAPRPVGVPPFTGSAVAPPG